MIWFDRIQGKASRPEPRVIVYREIGEDGNPAEHKTLTLWNDYAKPTNTLHDHDKQIGPTQEEHRTPREEHHRAQEGSLISLEEYHQSQDNYMHKDTHILTVTQVVVATAIEEPILQPSQSIPEETLTSTVIDPPKEAGVEDTDDQPIATTVITETLFSTETITLGTSIVTRTVIKGANGSDILFQHSMTNSFTIASKDLLFRANQGEKHNMDNLLCCIVMTVMVVLGIL